MTWRERLRRGLPLLPISGGAEGTIGIDEPVTVDKELDTFTVVQTVSTKTVHREALVVADPVDYAEIARVTAANGVDVDVTRLPALVAGTANIGDVGVLTLPALPAGTNNIGDVDVLSIAAGNNNIGDVDVASIAAGDNKIGRVIFNPNAAVLTSASISVASSGANELVSATGGQTTKVYAIFLVVAAAVNIKFQSAATDLTGLMTMTASGSLVLDNSGEPWFTTATNEAFNLNLSGAVQVSGRIYYVKS
jgi:hypothetical protein